MTRAPKAFLIEAPVTDVSYGRKGTGSAGRSGKSILTPEVELIQARRDRTIVKSARHFANEGDCFTLLHRGIGPRGFAGPRGRAASSRTTT